jgi:hypothetical protein
MKPENAQFYKKYSQIHLKKMSISNVGIILAIIIKTLTKEIHS